MLDGTRRCASPFARSAGTRGVAKRSVRALFLRPLTLRLPVRAEVAHGWRVLRSYLSLAPAMLSDRKRQRRTVSRRSVMHWQP